ncbi:hypothetical protein C8Q76DRAFT_861376 [Earliella scabrosa]|nr:hypothetical protein C8Q76DRAFT_861376 [Earliella scabrosa]
MSATESALAPESSHPASSRKRARTDGEALRGGAGAGEHGGLEAHPLKRDDEFWLDDGTVILVARDVEFRVYSGLLVSLSTVFQDLLAQPHELRALSIHGSLDIQCPVVRLSDSPEDLRHILRAYMPGVDTTPYDDPHPSFERVSAFIRLGRKYQMTALYARSVQYLKDHYPSNYDSWKQLALAVPRNWCDEEVIGVVNLARLIGEPTLLPTALLSCIYLEEDIAKTALWEAGIAAVLRTLSSAVSPKCEQSSQCQRALRKGLRGLHLFTPRLISGNLFGRWTGYVKDEIYHDLCTVCEDMLDDKHHAEATELWDSLPELLGIEVPGWGEPTAHANAG